MSRQTTDHGCIMTETMVDLLEGVIDAHALQRAFAHASRCATCRAVLSSLARDPAFGDAGTAPT